MSMKFDWLNKHWKKIVWLIVLVAGSYGAYVTQAQWMPHARRFVEIIQNKKGAKSEDDAEGMVATSDTLTLSPTAWKNIGLVTGAIEPSDFMKVVSVPAMVVERLGRTQNEITAPMTGVITRVYPLERQTIEPGMPLFDLRLTHEAVVTAQGEFLYNLQNLDVVKRELTRLRNIGEGVIPGKRIIEQTYEFDKIEAALSATRQSLMLHGMSEEQVANIEKTHKVLRSITVVVPPYPVNHEYPDIVHQYHVQSIVVNRGENVQAGQLMAVLADHGLLYLEGQAFEDDAQRLMDAADSNATVQVAPVSGDYDASDILSLKVQSVADQVDRQSRALKFYLLLPNQLVDPEGSPTSKKGFISWKFRPGQRMEARIPTSDLLKNKIVLSPEAVVIEGPNAFVFEQNGDNFDRIDVHVLYRDKDTVVLENDGQLIGSVIAMSGAYQMHLALKNQSGGAIDPHAGHNH